MDDGNYIFAKIHSKNVKPLLDTGSNSNILDFNLAKQLHLNIKPSKSIFTLYTANSEKLPIVGIAEFDLILGNCHFPTEAYVVRNLAEKILLGRKFLKQYNCTINYCDNSITIDDICQMPIDNSNSRIQAVRASADTEIAPNAVAVVYATIDKSLINKDLLITNRPGKQFQKFGIQRILLHPKQNSIPCRIINFRQNTIVIKKDEIIGQAEIVEPKNCLQLYNENDVINFERELEKTKSGTTNNITQVNCDRTAHDETLTDEDRKRLDNFIIDYKITINKKLPQKDYYDLAALLYRYREIFVNDILKLKPMKIPPVRWFTKKHGTCKTRQYRLSQEAMVEIDKQVQQLQESKLIESATLEGMQKYLTPITIVRKHDGSARCVLDFRKINSITLAFSCNFPAVDDVIHKISKGNSSIYSSVDIKSAFWAVPLHEKSRDMTTFVNPLTQTYHRWKVAPFGAVNSGSSWNTAIQTILRQLGDSSNITFYVDDGAVATDDMPTHIQQLERLFRLFKRFRVPINIAKSSFGTEKLQMLGYEIQGNKYKYIARNRSKILETAASLTSQKQAKRWLSMASYFRKTVPNFAQLTSNIRKLTRPNTPFKWTSECEREFRHINKILCDPPVLTALQPNRPIFIITDSSQTGTAFCIGQRDDEGIFHPAGWGGHCLTAAQRNYHINDLELLAVVSALRQYEHIIRGSQIIIITDSSVVANFKSMKDLTPRRHRMLSYISSFNISTVLEKSANNPVDFLSRSFENMDKTQQQEWTPKGDKADDYVMHLNEKLSVGNQEANKSWVAISMVNDKQTDSANQMADVINVTTVNVENQPNGDSSSQLTDPDDQIGEDDSANIKARIQNFVCDLNLTESDYLDDGEFQDMFQFLKTGKLAESDTRARAVLLLSHMFQIHNNYLYRYCEPRRRKNLNAESLQLKLCLPEKYQHTAIQYLHALSGHCGMERLQLIASKYLYFKQLFHTAVEVVRKCKDCAQFKLQNACKQRPLQPFMAPKFGEIWFIDHWKLTKLVDDSGIEPDPTLPSSSLYSHVLVAVEGTTSWPEAILVHGTSALESARAFVHLIVSRFGLRPNLTIKLDSATSWASKFMNCLSQILGVKLQIAPAGSHREMGRIEITIRKLQEIVRNFITDDYAIAHALPLGLLAIRLGVTATHQLQIFESMHGIAFPIPGLSAAVRDQLDNIKDDEKKYLLNLHRRLQAISQQIEHNTQIQRQIEKAAFDKRYQVREIAFKPGQRVWLRSLGPTAGSSNILTHRRFTGPYIIGQVIDPGPREHYKLIHEATGRPYRWRISHDRLKIDRTGDGTETRPDNQPENKPMVRSKSYLPVVKILRKRNSADGSKEYFVILKNGQRIWTSNVNPKLIH